MLLRLKTTTDIAERNPMARGINKVILVGNLGKDPETGVIILDEDPNWVWIREAASGAYIELRLDKEYGYVINIIQGEFELIDFELGGQDNEITIEQYQ